MKMDVVIIGAGPAGLSAAIELAKKNLEVIVLDEYYIPGGRLLAQHYIDPNLTSESKLWDGYKIAEELTAEAKKLGVTIMCGVSVWRIEKRWKVYITGNSNNTIRASKLIIATGAAEKSLPIQGWTLPGVFSIGAAQTFTNLHKVSLGKRVMIVGTDPLALSVFMEMKEAGVDVVSVVLPPKTPLIDENLTSPVKCVEQLTRLSHFAPNYILRKLGKFVSGKMVTLATRMLRFNVLKMKGAPIFLRKAIVSIGGDATVQYVYLQNVSIDGQPIGEKEKVEVDAVCLSAGLYPLVDAFQSVSKEMVTIEDLGGTVPLHALDMTTMEKDLFVAGNITGVEGAKVAMAQGRLSAISILNSLNIKTNRSVKEAIKEVEQARKDSPIHFIPTIEKGRKEMKQRWENNYEKELV